jgi:hypothetical protein
MTEVKKPKIAEKEIDKLQKQFDKFDDQIKDLNEQRENCSRKEEVEPPRVSQKEIEKTGDVYLKPVRWIADGQKFNEKFQKEWEFAKEYVRCIPIHNELKGDVIEKWTHPFGGKGAEFWRIPTDKPVMVPRYLAEELKKCNYHRLRMDEAKVTSADGMGSYTGQMVVDTVVQRLDAHPVNNKKSVFFSEAANF